ncbi:DNA polymerase III subunit delta [Mycoplasma sp. 128]|uniref:DNA polymerase III subunit delta n=1 Tax=Mycoplasma sp. 3341 TaxID=3447506 RepID=UPI003F65A893
MNFVYGDEKFFVEFYIKKFIKANKDVFDRRKFDESSDLEDIFDALSSVDIFDEKRLVIIENLVLFKDLKNQKKDIDKFIEVLDNLSPTVEVLISLYSEQEAKISQSKIFKYLTKKANVKKVNKLKAYEMNAFIKKYVEDNKGSITPDAINDIVARYGSNLFLICQDLDKYLVNKEQPITLKTMENDEIMFSENPEFAFGDAFLKCVSNEKLYEKFEEQMLMGTPFALLNTWVVNILEQAIKIHVLRQNKLSDSEIIMILKLHAFRFKLINNFLNFHKIEQIQSWMSQVSQLDLDLKEGFLSEEVCLSKFITVLME